MGFRSAYTARMGLRGCAVSSLQYCRLAVHEPHLGVDEHKDASMNPYCKPSTLVQELGCHPETISPLGIVFIFVYIKPKRILKILFLLRY